MLRTQMRLKNENIGFIYLLLFEIIIQYRFNYLLQHALMRSKVTYEVANFRQTFFRSPRRTLSIYLPLRLNSIRHL